MPSISKNKLHSTAAISYKELLLFVCLLILTSLVQAQEKISLQLKWHHQFQFAGYYAAKALGYYRDAGLDVDIVEADTDKDPVQNVLDGHAQYGVGTNDLLLLRNAGKPLVVLAVVFQHSPYVLITSQRDANQSIHDLIGKRVMISPHAYELIAYLKKEGIDTKQLNLQPYSFDVQDLVKNKTDAYAGYITNDVFALEQKNFPYAAYTARSAGIDFYGDNLFTTEHEIERHPMRVKAFREASLKGWRYAMRYPVETVDLMIQAHLVPATSRQKLLFEAHAMEALIQPALVEVGYMSIDRWQHVADIYSSFGLMSAHTDLNAFLYNPQQQYSLYKLLLDLGVLLLILVVPIAAFLIRRYVQNRKSIWEMRELIDGVFLNSPNFLYVKDARSLKFVRINPAMCKALGLSEQEFKDKTNQQIYSSKLAHLLDLKDKEAITTGEPVNLYEVSVQTPFGERIWRLMKLALKNTHGQATHILGFGQDITERKKAEEKLKANEALWSMALDVAGQGVWDWYLDTNAVTYSKNWHGMLGYNQVETQGSFEDFLRLVYPEDLPRVNALVKVYLLGEIPEFSSEIRMLCQDGSWKWILTRGTIVERDAQNLPKRMIGTHLDITEQKLAEQRELWRNQVLELLSGDADLTTILNAIATGVEKQKVGVKCVIMLLEQDHLSLAAAPSLPEAERQAVERLQQGFSGERQALSAHDRKMVVIENMQTHQHWHQFRPLVSATHLVSCWVAPIYSLGENIMGTFSMYFSAALKPSEADFELLESSAKFTALAIQRKQTADTISKQANYDALTQLPNRRLFQDRLQMQMRKVQRDELALALMFIDLDRFKEVNDTLGHHVGDSLLIEASKRIVACVRASDTVARLGGDEFTVILSDIHDARQIDRVAQNIINALREPYYLDGELVYNSASIGITLYPNDGLELDTLLKNADQAMFEAKKIGRNCYCYFTYSLQVAAQSKQRLMNELRVALASQQFSLHYQPVMDIANNVLVKVEALIRWHHPERGLINPADFIPVAEEAGLIHELGNWVFAEAVRHKQQWPQYYTAPLQLSINVSPVQFNSSDWVQVWLDTLQAYGLRGNEIVLEITEGLLLNVESGVTEALLKFRDAGVEIAIDDFGTGYSSLSYLKKFDIDYLKIDRSFVRDLCTDPSDLALSEAIIVMAHKLGLKVIAEGVEFDNQRQALLDAGCDYGQGYLFSRPIPAHEFEQYLVGLAVK